MAQQLRHSYPAPCTMDVCTTPAPAAPLTLHHFSFCLATTVRCPQLDAAFPGQKRGSEAVSRVGPGMVSLQ